VGAAGVEEEVVDVVVVADVVDGAREEEVADGFAVVDEVERRNDVVVAEREEIAVGLKIFCLIN